MLRSALFFPRADHLGDEFEGAIPSAYHKLDNRIANSAAIAQQSLQKLSYVSCWHLLEYESVAMWRPDLGLEIAADK